MWFCSLMYTVMHRAVARETSTPSPVQIPVIKRTGLPIGSCGAPSSPLSAKLIYESYIRSPCSPYES